MLSDGYRKLLEQTHKESDYRWGQTARRNLYRIVAHIEESGCTNVLDYGSAGGSFERELIRRGLLPHVSFLQYDPGYPDKAHNNLPRDFVLCSDVLEHVEPDQLENVLEDLYRCMRREGYFSIGCYPAEKELPDGRNAHLILEDPSWWIDKLEEWFTIEKDYVTVNGAGGKTLHVHVKPKEEKNERNS